jgi:hypothetical protein
MNAPPTLPKEWKWVAVLGIRWGGKKSWRGFWIQIKATEFWRDKKVSRRKLIA